jgi:enoyl-CoA hydratase/carnithine racemase
MTFASVRYEKRDTTAWVTLNRPEVLNAYNLQMRDDLFEVFSAIHDDAEVRLLVLNGAGRAFCAGADLTEFGTAPSPTIARRIRFARDVWHALDSLPVPTLAALHGFAFGSGFELALFCDLRIAAEGTRLGFPEARLGMIPAAGGTVTLRRVTGPGPALDLLLTGRRIDAREALRIGAVSFVVPLDRLGAETQRLSEQLLALEDGAVRNIRSVVRQGFDMPLDQALRYEARLSAGLRRDFVQS